MRDNAASFGESNSTRFASTNICDYIVHDDNSNTLYLLELKSTKSTSIPLNMIRDNQIQGLLEASKHRLIAGFFFNYRNINNDTFFMKIIDFINMVDNLEKKSFNIIDVANNGGVRIESTKKRVRYTYNIEKFLQTIHL